MTESLNTAVSIHQKTNQKQKGPISEVDPRNKLKNLIKETELRNQTSKLTQVKTGNSAQDLVIQWAGRGKCHFIMTRQEKCLVVNLAGCKRGIWNSNHMGCPYPVSDCPKSHSIFPNSYFLLLHLGGDRWQVMAHILGSSALKQETWL